MSKTLVYFSLLALLLCGSLVSCNKICRKWEMKAMEVGDKVDSLNGVYVYYNNTVGNVEGRNLAADGYNLGLKYQCVEFVKRYYYEYINHKMPDSYGHAKDFYQKGVPDATYIKSRDLVQYANPSSTKPRVSDLVVYDATIFNRFGHVAIVSRVTDSKIEIIQQNPGAMGPSRETYSLSKTGGKWEIGKKGILGWLSKRE